MSFWGAIEAGGTKFVCAIADDDGKILDEVSFPTTTYRQTLQQVLDYLDQHHTQKALAGVGISSFGPIDLVRTSPTYGYITSTPKVGWKDVDLVGPIYEKFRVPIGFDTDVNGAALAEYRWGAAQGLDTVVYITVGTGIGGGGLINGKPMHGLIHPEMGHMLIPQDVSRDDFEGICSFHKNCLEGLASGPAIKARWGTAGQALAPDHPAWALEAHYLSYGLVNIILCLSPQKIILGGGVMKQKQLFPFIRKNVLCLLNNYVSAQEILVHPDEYIVPTGLGIRSGVMGGVALAQQEAAAQSGD
jgi:fructokinase